MGKTGRNRRVSSGILVIHVLILFHGHSHSQIPDSDTITAQLLQDCPSSIATSCAATTAPLKQCSIRGLYACWLDVTGATQNASLRVLVPDTHSSWLVPVLGRFSDEYGVPLELNVQPFSQLLPTILADVDLPAHRQHVVWLQTTLTTQHLADAGLSVDLSHVVDIAGSSLQWSDIFQTFRLQLACYRGTTYALPLDGSTRYLMARSAVMERLGVQVPETWQGLLQFAASYPALLRAAAEGADGTSQEPSSLPPYPICLPRGATCSQASLLQAIWSSLAQTRGPQQGVHFDPADPALPPLLDTPAAREAFRLLARLQAAAAPPEPDEGCWRGSLAFARGRCALVLAGFSPQMRLLILPEYGAAIDMDDLQVVPVPGSDVVWVRGTDGTAAGSGGLQTCTPELCPYATAAAGSGGGTVLINHTPSSPGSNLAGALNSMQPLILQFIGYSLLEYLASPERYGPAEPVPLLQTLAPVREFYVSVGAVDNWVAAGFSRRLMLQAMPTAMRFAREHPNRAWDLRMPFHMAYYDVLEGILRGLRNGSICLEDAAGGGGPEAGGGQASAESPPSVTVRRALRRAAARRARKLLQSQEGAEGTALPVASPPSQPPAPPAPDLGPRVALAVALRQGQAALVAYYTPQVFHQRYLYSLAIQQPSSTGDTASPSTPAAGRGDGAQLVDLAAALAVSVLTLLAIAAGGGLLWRRHVARRRARGLAHEWRSRMSGGRLRGMPEESVAVLVTDIQDSTCLWEACPAAVMSEAVRLHHATVRRLLCAHGGYESSTEGDSFILAFRSVKQAVAFALELQAQLLQQPWPEDLLTQPVCSPVALDLPEGFPFVSRQLPCDKPPASAATSRRLLGRPTALEPPPPRPSLDELLRSCPDLGASSGSRSFSVTAHTTGYGLEALQLAPSGVASFWAARAKSFKSRANTAASTSGSTAAAAAAARPTRSFSAVLVARRGPSLATLAAAKASALAAATGSERGVSAKCGGGDGDGGGFTPGLPAGNLALASSSQLYATLAARGSTAPDSVRTVRFVATPSPRSVSGGEDTGEGEVQGEDGTEATMMEEDEDGEVGGGAATACRGPASAAGALLRPSSGGRGPLQLEAEGGACAAATASPRCSVSFDCSPPLPRHGPAAPQRRSVTCNLADRRCAQHRALSPPLPLLVPANTACPGPQPGSAAATTSGPGLARRPEEDSQTPLPASLLLSTLPLPATGASTGTGTDCDNENTGSDASRCEPWREDWEAPGAPRSRVSSVRRLRPSPGARAGCDAQHSGSPASPRPSTCGSQTARPPCASAAQPGLSVVRFAGAKSADAAHASAVQPRGELSACSARRQTLAQLLDDAAARAVALPAGSRPQQNGLGGLGFGVGKGPLPLFRGLRVRVGISWATPSAPELQYNAAAARMVYGGPCVAAAKAVADMAAGGQVVLSGAALARLEAECGGVPGGRPSGTLVLHLGTYALPRPAIGGQRGGGLLSSTLSGRSGTCAAMGLGQGASSSNCGTASTPCTIIDTGTTATTTFGTGISIISATGASATGAAVAAVAAIRANLAARSSAISSAGAAAAAATTRAWSHNGTGAAGAQHTPLVPRSSRACPASSGSNAAAAAAAAAAMPAQPQELRSIYWLTSPALSPRLALMPPLRVPAEATPLWEVFGAPVGRLTYAVVQLPAMPTLLAWNREAAEEALLAFGAAALAALQRQSCRGACYLVPSGSERWKACAAFSSAAAAVWWAVNLRAELLAARWPQELLQHELCEVVEALPASTDPRAASLRSAGPSCSPVRARSKRSRRRSLAAFLGPAEGGREQGDQEQGGSRQQPGCDHAGSPHEPDMRLGDVGGALDLATHSLATRASSSGSMRARTPSAGQLATRRQEWRPCRLSRKSGFAEANGRRGGAGGAGSPDTSFRQEEPVPTSLARPRVPALLGWLLQPASLSNPGQRRRPASLDAHARPFNQSQPFQSTPAAASAAAAVLAAAGAELPVVDGVVPARRHSHDPDTVSPSSSPVAIPASALASAGSPPLRGSCAAPPEIEPAAGALQAAAHGISPSAGDTCADAAAVTPRLASAHPQERPRPHSTLHTIHSPGLLGAGAGARATSRSGTGTESGAGDALAAGASLGRSGRPEGCGGEREDGGAACPPRPSDASDLSLQQQEPLQPVVLLRGPRMRAGIASGTAEWFIQDGTHALAYSGRPVSAATKLAAAAASGQVLCDEASRHEAAADEMWAAAASDEAPEGRAASAGSNSTATPPPQLPPRQGLPSASLARSLAFTPAAGGVCAANKKKLLSKAFSCWVEEHARAEGRRGNGDGLPRGPTDGGACAQPFTAGDASAGSTVAARHCRASAEYW